MEDYLLSLQLWVTSLLYEQEQIDLHKGYWERIAEVAAGE